MLIKRQISLLILTLLVLPFAGLIFFPLFYIFQDSNSQISKMFLDERKRNPTILSDTSWEQIQRFIEEKPRDLDIMVIFRQKVLFSTFSDFPKDVEVTPPNFFGYLETSISNYDYMIQSFYVINDELFITGEDKLSMGNDSTDTVGYVISRRNIDNKPKEHTMQLRYKIFFHTVIIIMELLSIMFGFYIVRIISNSVIKLKMATENIINGDIETPIDTTPNKGEAEEIVGLSENLEKMRVSLKDNKERKSRFVMGISHDLRTPVALIKGYSEAIEDGVITGENLTKSACLINQNAVRLEEMINDLINYIRLNNTDWKQKLEAVALKPHLESFVRSISAAAELFKRKISGTINIPDDTMVKMDANLFQRVIENLYTNALHYTKEGDSISLNARLNENGVPEITFSDTGCGIAEKDREKVFDLFYRGTDSRREDGMGIGLSVVKTVIEAHGWDIRIESEENKGTDFIITLN